MTVHRVHVAVILCGDGDVYADADYLGDDDPSKVQLLDGDRVLAEQTFLLREPEEKRHEVLLVRLPSGGIVSQLDNEPLRGEVLARATITEGQGV